MTEPAILVVDDDEGIRESLSRELRAAGYDTITAIDGHSGLAAFRVNLPDILLTDLAMPGADGRRLRIGLRPGRKLVP